MRTLRSTQRAKAGVGLLRNKGFVVVTGRVS
jgi:hypothetical protein